MATLAEIRRRIASVKNTQQITRAMQAVAASKLRRVQARAEAARPYADRMADVLVEVASRVTSYQHPFLIERPVKKRLLILVSSDRGLAGGLNVNAFRVALGYIRQGDVVLDTVASFYAAQMVAMRNATDNAGELIEDLTLLRNKVRQATITKELSEIVGGAEALTAG